MTSQEQYELETVSKLLATEQGGVLVSWLKRKAGFDLPVFDPASGLDEKQARLVDGGRQLVIALTNAPSEYKALKRVSKKDD